MYDIGIALAPQRWRGVFCGRELIGISDPDPIQDGKAAKLV